jgi:hypothetical protein
VIFWFVRAISASVIPSLSEAEAEGSVRRTTSSLPVHPNTQVVSFGAKRRIPAKLVVETAHTSFLSVKFRCSAFGEKARVHLVADQTHGDLSLRSR